MKSIWKAFPGRRKIVGELGDRYPGNVLFAGELDLPPAQLIIEFLETSEVAGINWKLPRNYVVRGPAHLRGWLHAFLDVEQNELMEKFSPPERSFETVVIGNRAMGCVDISVRLKTAGQDGSTEYRLSIIKSGHDSFICVE